MQGAHSGDWPALAELGLAVVSGTILWLWPHSAPWPLALALLPWLWRLSQRRFPFQRTSLDLPIAIFLVTAAIAAWASYDRQAAPDKLWLLVGAVLLYYALARQPGSNFLLVAAFLSAVGAVIAIYFLLTNDWRLQPADLEFINRLGYTLATLRPKLGLPPPQPNIAGGLIALFAPFTLALLVETWNKGYVSMAVYALITGGLAAFGLLMTSSRAAWLALGMGLGLWLLWELCGWMEKNYSVRQSLVFTTCLALLAALAFTLVLRTPGGLLGLVNRLPGSNNATVRLDIYSDALQLVQDYPYTGGGLHAFSGLFSQYIQVIPFFIFAYAHNMYLDLAVEQGLLGLAAFLWILLGGARLLSKSAALPVLRWAIFVSTLVMIAHGLVDDPLYASRGTPFLFFLPALSVAIARPQEASAGSLPERRGSTPWRAVIAVLAILLAASLTYLNWKPLLASWYANLGAVRMAQVELADYPSGRWKDASQVLALADAEALFKQAIEINPGNVTASYRLGLINMLRRDYRAAQGYLENAYAKDPKHLGVRKSLGYCYVWLGNYERARDMLWDISKTRAELGAYTVYWAEQGRPDLAERAKGMIRRLESEE